MATFLSCGSRALRASAWRAPSALQIRAFASSDPTVPKLPELPYDYGDLEPVISAEIMKLHHQKHHQAYINGYLQAKEKYEAAQEKGDLETMISLQPAIRFNGGGHVNHSIFWKNLCPPKEYAPPEGKLADKIEADFGSLDKLQSKLSTTAAGVQGSGWGWLGYNKDTDKLVIATTANQDPLTTLGLTPLLGIDVWEHAYYLQYKNVRPDYLKNIWKVVNWKDVSSRLPA
jgi:Fe-Mn family superoxide dismutase